MRSSRWQAQGNVYLVAEHRSRRMVREEVGDADGILEVRDTGEDWVEIAIWNPDGSRAEMSGNGTRIAARWLADRTGAEQVTVRVGPRRRGRPNARGRVVEQDLGPVSVGAPEVVEGIAFTPVDVGNPHAVVVGDPAEIVRIGPLLETHTHFPNRTNVQVARRIDAETIEARVWERGVGETGASGTSAIAVVAAFGDLKGHRSLPGRRPSRADRGRPGSSDGLRRARQRPRRSILRRMRRGLVVVAACSRTAAPASAAGIKLTSYPVPRGGFSIMLPSDWVDVTNTTPTAGANGKIPSLASIAKAATADGTKKLIVVDPAGNGSRYIDVDVERIGAVTTATAAAATVKALHSGLPVTGKVTASPVKLAAGPAYLIHFDYKRSGSTYETSEYLLVHDQIEYLVIYVAPVSTGRRWRPSTRRAP